jgi:serine/threonine protein kinase
MIILMITELGAEVIPLKPDGTCFASGMLTMAASRPYSRFHLRGCFDKVSPDVVKTLVDSHDQFLRFLQSRGLKGVDRTTDVYSLGVMLFQILTGRMPFEGSSPMEILMIRRLQAGASGARDDAGEVKSLRFLG